MEIKLSKFYREYKSLINITIISFFFSLITMLLTNSNNLYLLYFSIPTTVISLIGIYFIIYNYKDEVNNVKSIKERERKQKIKDKEIEIFKNLSLDNKKQYLNKNPNSLIYSVVKKYLKINEKKDKLRKIIEIEKELSKKFNDQFYSEINLLNFSEKLNLVSTRIENDRYKEIYFEEKILEEKIIFFPFFKILKNDYCDLMYQFQKSNLFKTRNNIEFNLNSSINDNFILRLNQILKITEDSLFIFFDKGNETRVLINKRMGNTFYLKELITNHLINNYEKFRGKNVVIDNLSHLYKKYKYFNSGHIHFDFQLKEEWDYVFYNKEKSDEVKELNDNNLIKGEEVLRKLNSILEE